MKELNLKVDGFTFTLTLFYFYFVVYSLSPGRCVARRFSPFLPSLSCYMRKVARRLSLSPTSSVRGFVRGTRLDGSCSYVTVLDYTFSLPRRSFVRGTRLLAWRPVNLLLLL